MLICFLSTAYVSASENPSSDMHIQIRVNETSQLNSDQITLGQVSKIDANGFLKASLEKLLLGNSPKPDQIKAFDRSKILALIRSQKNLPAQITVLSPDRIYVKRLSQTVLKKDVRQFVIQSLDQQFFNKKYELARFDVRGLAVYPQGQLSFRADSSGMVDTKGRLSFFLDLLIDGVKKDRLTVKGTIIVYEQVLCAVRQLKKGQPVLRQDLNFEMKNIFDLDSNYIVDFKTIEKKIVKTGIKKGAYLKQDLFAYPYLVKKGDMVTLVAKNNNMRIITSGICKEDGFENTLIKVENLNSGKLVRGIVKDKSRVEVVY